MKTSCSHLPAERKERLQDVMQRFCQALFRTLEISAEMRAFFMKQKLGIDLLGSVRTYSSMPGVESDAIENMLQKAHETLQEAASPHPEKLAAVASMYDSLVGDLKQEVEQLEGDKASAAR